MLQTDGVQTQRAEAKKKALGRKNRKFLARFSVLLFAADIAAVFVLSLVVASGDRTKVALLVAGVSLHLFSVLFTSVGLSGRLKSYNS